MQLKLVGISYVHNLCISHDQDVVVVYGSVYAPQKAIKILKQVRGNHERIRVRMFSLPKDEVLL